MTKKAASLAAASFHRGVDKSDISFVAGSFCLYLPKTAGYRRTAIKDSPIRPYFMSGKASVRIASGPDAADLLMGPFQKRSHFPKWVKGYISKFFLQSCQL